MNMKSSNIFVTGCDANNKWMLDWLIENFEKHHGDESDLYIVDFDEGYPCLLYTSPSPRDRG